MMLKKSFSMIALLPCLLTGCHQNHDDMWYMQHPAALQEALLSCQSATGARKEQCDRLLPVAENLQLIIMDQQTHPEAFGRRILREQEHLAQLQDAVKQAHAQGDLVKAQKAVTEQEQQLKVLLAVIALSSPDK